MKVLTGLNQADQDWGTQPQRTRRYTEGRQFWTTFANLRRPLRL